MTNTSVKFISLVAICFSLLTVSSQVDAKANPSTAIISCANKSSGQMRYLKTGVCKKSETRLSLSKSMQVKTAKGICINNKSKVMRYVSSGKCKTVEASMLSVFSTGAAKKQSICISKSSTMRYVISKACASSESSVGSGSLQELIDLLRSLIGYLTATTAPMAPSYSTVASIPSATNIVTTSTSLPLTTSTITSPSTSTTSTTTTTSTIPTTTTTTIPGSFTSGTKTIGASGIAAGRYITTSASSCYWARLSGFGGTLDEIIANDNAPGSHVIVDISSSDLGFTSSRCGSWVPFSSAITVASVISNGVWKVGSEMAAGTWSSPGSSSCYWARLSGFGGTLDEIIANDFSTSDAVIVTVSSSDVGFTTTRCGTWTKIS